MTRLHCPEHGPIEGRKCGPCAGVWRRTRRNQNPAPPSEDYLAAEADFRRSQQMVAFARECAGDRLPTPIDLRRSTPASKETNA